VLTSAVEWAALPAGAPAALHRLLHRCLERDSRRRLRDVGEARVALEDSIAGRPDEPAIARAAPSMARRGGGWRLVGLAVGLGIVAGIGGAALTGWFRRPAVAEAIHVRALTYSGADSEPAASPDGKLIAFTSWRDGVARIWLKQLAGGGEAPLTSGPDGHARFSPDGASLLFVRDLGATQAVYRTSLVGGEPRRLVNDATAADWSPDGRHIVFVRNGIDPAHASTIGIFDLESGAEQIRARLGDVLAYSPRWSPDGRQIAFASGSWSADDWKLDELDVATGLLRAVPPGALHPPMSGIAWSGRGNALFFVQSSSLLGDLAGFGSRIIRCEPRSGERRTVLWSDGIAWTTATADEISATDVLAPGRLLFSQRLKRQSLREVDLRPAGGASSARVLAEGSSIDRQPTYSPDGREILFSSNRGGNLDLWTLDRASGALRRVTDDPAQDWDPAYAADGRHVIWSSDRASGHLEIWMANADGSGARQVTHDGVSAQNPESTPGGRWIVYWSGNPAKLGIWKIHPDGSDATRLLPGSRIQTEVSPDGRYVLYEQQDRLNLRNTIHFLELKSGRVLPVAIEVRYTVGAPAIIWGRARWSADGKAIYFVGEDERGLSGVYAQQFSPDRDTSATRRPVAGFSPDYVTESLGLSPDGSRLAISGGLESASIMVADGVPGALPMARTAP
jgi:Tol biopolymer transport system component